MSGGPALAEAREGVLEITIARPQARNAVDAAFAEKRPPVWRGR